MSIERYEGTEPIKVSAERVMQVVAEIMNSGMQDDFLAACEEAGFGILVPPADVNFLKEYFSDKLPEEEANLSLEASPSAMTRVVRSIKCT